MSLFPVLLIVSSVTAFLADISPFVSYEILLVALIVKIVHAFGLMIISIDQVARVVNLNITSWSLALFENLSGGNVLLYALIYATICENTRKLERHFFVCRAFLFHAFGLFVGEMFAALLDFIAYNSQRNFFLWYALSYLSAVSVVFVYALRVSRLVFPESVIGERILNDSIAAQEGTSYVQFSDDRQRYNHGNADAGENGGKWPVCLNVLIFTILLVAFVIVNDDFGFINEASYTAYHVSLYFDNWTVAQYPVLRIAQAGFRTIGLLITGLYFLYQRNNFTIEALFALVATMLQFVHYSLFYKINGKTFVWNTAILSVLVDAFHFVPSVAFMSIFSKEYSQNNNKLFCLVFILERLFQVSWRYVIFGASYQDLITLQTNNTFILKSLCILFVLLLLTPLVIFYHCRQAHSSKAVRLVGFRHRNTQVCLELKQGDKSSKGNEEQDRHRRPERKAQRAEQHLLEHLRGQERNGRQAQHVQQSPQQVHAEPITQEPQPQRGPACCQTEDVGLSRHGGGGGVGMPFRKTFDRFKRSRVAFRRRGDNSGAGYVSMRDKFCASTATAYTTRPVLPSSTQRNVRLLSVVNSVDGKMSNRMDSSSAAHDHPEPNGTHNLEQVYMCTEV